VLPIRDGVGPLGVVFVIVGLCLSEAANQCLQQVVKIIEDAPELFD
jgi:hypothetical protein